MVMKKPKIVVMDMGGTLLDSKNVNFELGVRYLYDHYCHHNISYEELLEEYKLVCATCFKKRDHEDFELSFHHILNYIDKIIGFKNQVDYYQLEREFVDVTMPRKLVDDVEIFLREMKKQDIPVYVLSNSCFSSQELKHELEEFKVLEYFKDVFSSGDYIMRKPSIVFYHLITMMIKRNYPNVSLSDVWYIGNDYRCDIIGSSKAGLTSVWLNRLGQDNFENLDIINVSDYQELIKRMENE